MTIIRSIVFLLALFVLCFCQVKVSHAVSEECQDEATELCEDDCQWGLDACESYCENIENDDANTECIEACSEGKSACESQC